MRLFLIVAICLLAESARAAEYPIHGGDSPDRAYKVVVLDRGKGENGIRYAIRSRKTGRTLLTIPSSYQREGDAEFLAWPLRKSQEAQVAWNSDSSLVAIDEDVHRYIGDLFLVHVSRNHAARIDLKREAIEWAAHQPWDRVSIHQPEWTSAQELKVYLHGLLPATPPAWPVHKEFDVSLEVGRNHRVHIKSVQEILGHDN